MNWLGHIFTTYVLAKLIFNVTPEYIPIIVVFSILPDLDHFPALFKGFVVSARAAHRNRKKREHFDGLSELILFVVNIFLIPAGIFVSSMFDLKHVPFFFSKVVVDGDKHLGSDSRSRYHEFYGVFLFSFIACLVYLLFPSQHYAMTVVVFCLLMHFALDFLVGRTRPFYPYSNQVIHVVTYHRKIYRAVMELVYTLVAGGVFWFLTS